MMDELKNWALAVWSVFWIGALAGIVAPAHAQNPTCPTRPLGDSSNACASTAFVQSAIVGGIPLTQNFILVGSAGNLAFGVPLSGDCTIVAAGAITCTKTSGVSFGTLATLNAAPAGTLTGTTLNSTVVTSSLTAVGAVTTGRWNDTSEVIAGGPSKWNPLFFSNAGTGVVHRFNRVFVGEATASSSDVGPVTTKDWLETIVPNTTGVAQFSSVDTTGNLGIVAAARTSDYRNTFGLASGGAQGISGFGYNDDISTSATTATIGAAGSGYTNGTQTLTVLGGTCTVQPKINVTVAGNVVTAFSSVPNGGSCTVTPGNPAATSGGGGSGATLNVTYAAGNPIVCGVCGSAARVAGSPGLSVNQFDVQNAGSVVDVTPFGGVIAGSTISFLTTPGVVTGLGSTNTSAGWVVGTSSLGTRTRKGGVCLDGALDTAVGAGGDGVCVEMARNQSVRWLNSGGTTDGEITANASGIQFPTDQAWTTFTATPTCGNNAITTNRAVRKTLGKTTWITLDITINATIGTCLAALTFTLPNTAAGAAYIPAQEFSVSHEIAGCLNSTASTTSTCNKRSGANFVASERWIFTGVYDNQ